MASNIDDTHTRDHVFLSYAREDIEYALRLYDSLKKRKVNVWIDRKDIAPGKWKPQIIKAINRSKYFIICISKAALKKTGDEPGFQDEELNYAYNIAQAQSENDFVIIPVRIEDCHRGDHRLSIWQQFDIFDDFDEKVDELAVQIGGVSLSDATVKDKRNEDTKIFQNLYGRAMSKFFAGEYQNSIDICKSIEVVSPQQIEPLILKGSALFIMNQREEALSAFNKATELNSKHAHAWNNKGIVLHKLNRKEEALAAIDKALEYDPKYVKAWSNKGIMLSDLGLNEEALAAFNKATESDPKYFKAFFNRGCLYSRLREKDKMILDLKMAIDINTKCKDDAKSDEDFKPYWDDPDFKKLVK